MADTPQPEITDEQIIAFEVQARAVAMHIATYFQEVPPHIMASAMQILLASLLVDKDTYVSAAEQRDGKIYTEEENLQRIVDDIKARADEIRAEMKARGYTSGTLN